MADEDDDKSTGPVTFRHVRDGRQVQVRANATKQQADYDDHPNWERVD